MQPRNKPPAAYVEAVKQMKRQTIAAGLVAQGGAVPLHMPGMTEDDKKAVIRQAAAVINKQKGMTK